MTTQSLRRRLTFDANLTIGASFVAAAVTFAFDLAVPLGVAGGTLYVAVVLPALVSPARHHALLAALSGTALTIAGFFASPEIGEPTEQWMVITNRVLSLLGIWATALIVSWYVSARDTLTNALLELRDREALATLGEMATVVAHEVKNPLAGMRGALQVLAMRMPEGAREREIADKITARVDSLHRSLDDLLEFARPPRLTRSLTDLGTVVDDTVRLAASDPAWHDTSVQVDVEPVELLVDADRVSEALLNVVLNATQAAGPDGHIEIEGRTQGEWYCLHVRDDGPGLPEEARSRAFEPFFTTKTRGTGLGLAIVKRTIEAHGGTIELDSPDAGGTDLHVHLPLAPRR